MQYIERACSERTSMTEPSTNLNEPQGQGEASDSLRPGPRPLAFHLASALASLGGSIAALPGVQAGVATADTGVGAEAREFAAALADIGDGEVPLAAGNEAVSRLGVMMAGIEAYRRHAYRRDVEDPAVIWAEGSTRLLDYGGVEGAVEPGMTVLFAPSLVNRGYVLDLSAQRSMVRWMAQNGIRPLLIDWGAPGEAERDFTLDDYILGRLGSAIDEALSHSRGHTGDKIGLVGYCMGGDLALASAQRRQSDLSALALLATPWDFHGGSGLQGSLFAAARDSLDAVISGFGELPVDILQTFFASLDPALGLRKFRRFAELDPDGDKAAEFVALEDWLNDGVALTAAVAKTCLIEWYGENSTAEGNWLIGGEPVDPTAIDLPTLVAAPAADRIVPPESARPLADLIPGAELMTPPSGHIGMVVGSKAEQGLWRPLTDWLLAHA